MFSSVATDFGSWTISDELAFHRRGLCVSGSAHVTNGCSSGMMPTAGVELPHPRISRPSFGTKLLGGESNVTFVKR